MSQTTKPDDNPCRPIHFKPVLCAPAPTDGPGKSALDICHTRLIVAGLLFVVAFLAIGAQLVDVMELKSPDKSLARNRVVEHTVPSRADIVDRNGVLLATTLDMPSLYANPKQIADKEKIAMELAAIFPEIDGRKLADTFARPNLSFVWIKHNMTPREQLAVNALGEHGLQFLNEGRRVYPKGELFAHVVGFVNGDGKGTVGIEAGLEKRLRTDATPVRLSVDSRVQFILRAEILKQMAQFDAKRGFGIVMNVRNGEVLALSSLPDFDPNNLATATPDELYNHATFGVYEMGSVFKIFNTAMLLSSGLATMDTKFDATNPIHIGRFTIHDDHPQRRWLSVAEVFQYSSNIGSAKEALTAGADRQEEFLGKLGLLNTPHFEYLPEVAAPHIPSPWRDINVMTVAFGHGMSVSPLQMATAVSAVVNGGKLYQPTLVATDMEPQGRQVLDPEISDKMRRLLRLVVTSGTGKFAAAPGYLVGGKTGTAEEVQNAGYARKQLLASFVGVFPINDPQYVVIISIDQPHGNKSSYGYATAGWVAAPGVSHIIERMAPLVGIHPVDEDLPEIRRALMIDMPVPEGRKLAAE